MVHVLIRGAILTAKDIDLEVPKVV
jgi:hypothetical protein